MRDTVTLLVPTLNEVEGMRVIMPRVKREWVDQVLVVDGRSTDGTQEYARQCGYEVIEQSRPGLRHAYTEAFARVRGSVVITFSPDGNSVPEAIPQIIARMNEGYDMVIASRYFRGARSEDDDLVTRFGNWMFTTLINLLHGGRYTDSFVMFRAYRTRLFRELDLHKDESYASERWCGTVMGVEPLLSVRAARRRLRVCDVPVDEPRRLGGQRKLQVVRWGIAYLLQVLRELYYWR
jgi:glycosyltransferase involved in cell wall biosynthesis